MRYILLFVQMVLLSLGIWSFVDLLYQFLVTPAKKVYAPLVVPVEKNERALERTLRWAHQKTQRKFGVLYILDLGADPETAEICRRFASAYTNIEFGSFDQLKQKLCEPGSIESRPEI